MVTNVVVNMVVRGHVSRISSVKRPCNRAGASVTKMMAIIATNMETRMVVRGHVLGSCG